MDTLSGSNKSGSRSIIGRSTSGMEMKQTSVRIVRHVMIQIQMELLKLEKKALWVVAGVMQKTKIIM